MDARELTRRRDPAPAIEPTFEPAFGPAFEPAIEQGVEPDMRPDAGPDQVPRVNGVALAGPGETPDAAELRQRACTELLRQEAMREGLLASDDPVPVGGVGSEAASDAIEALLEKRVAQVAPDEAACRRYHASHAADFTVGERVLARHVLFAVTPGVDVTALRARAEATLLELRASGDAVDERFAAAALACSNCPSGAHGGALGWLERADCAPEFAAALFGSAEVGVLARLVHSRFGLHVVEVLARVPGELQPFEAVRRAIEQALTRQRFATALRDYLEQLAGRARLDGVDLEAPTTAPGA